jgi:hypothetical protein
MIHDGDDDDFDVGFEEGALDEEIGATDDQQIADADSQQAVSGDLPPDLEDEGADGAEGGEGDDKGDKGDKGDEGEEGDETDEVSSRIQAAEERALRAEVKSIYDEGQNALAFHDQQMNASRVALDALEDKISHATSLLAQAREAGDTVNELKIERSLKEMDALKAEINKARAEMPSKEQIVAYTEKQAKAHIEKARQSAPKGKDVGVGIAANTPLAAKWASSNGWMKTNKAANDFVIKQSQLLVKENWDMNTPGFYAELTRRVGRAFPNLKVSALQATKKGMSKGGVKSPVAPTRSSSGGAVRKAPASNPKQYQLTKADVVAMKRMRLNPLDKTHRREFAASRIESAQRERQFGN